MKKIIGQIFPFERDLYNQKGLHLIECSFSGKEDGESALKECSDILCERTTFALRYPLWHCLNVSLDQVNMLDTCRASLWYTEQVKICNSNLNGIKALRECLNIDIFNSNIVSDEFGWKCKNIKCDKSVIKGNYLFFESKDIELDNSFISGKYNFQYVNNVTLNNCIVESKDFFWHAKDVIIKDSVIKGEYLAWYSENLTLINCKISGTQPFCYCKNLKLINCEMIDTDLSFEYSEVEATINGTIKSVKNPLKGKIEADLIEEIILTEDKKYLCEAIIYERERM